MLMKMGTAQKFKARLNGGPCRQVERRAGTEEIISALNEGKKILFKTKIY